MTVKDFKDALRSLFIKNAGLKFIAVGLAIILYVIAHGETVREVEIIVPLVASTLPADRVLLVRPPDSISVRVRGNLQRLTEILSRRTPYELDLSGVEGEQTLYLDPDAMETHLGKNIKVVSVSPTSFKLVVDQVVTRTVPVDVNIVKDPGDFWSADRGLITVEPRLVQVRGASGLVDTIKSIRTEPIDLTGINRDYRGKVRLEIPTDIKVNPASVQLSIPIQARSDSKTLKGVRMAVRDCPEGFSCVPIPPTYNIHLEGPKKILSELDSNTISQYVYIDAGNLGIKSETVQKKFRSLAPEVGKLSGVRISLVGAKYFHLKVVRESQ